MILLRWFITTLAIFALPYFVAGITVNGIITALIVSACLVFLNMVVKPIVTILTLPINILTQSRHSESPDIRGGDDAMLGGTCVMPTKTS